MGQTKDIDDATASDAETTSVVESETKKRVYKTSKMSKSEIKKALKSLETRMERADTLTRKSVETLEDVVSTLDARTRLDSAEQKSALSRQIGKLANSLEEAMSTTREDIRTTLARSLNHANIPALETAIRDASARLKDTETQHAKSIAKINRHLANLAKAVEDRIINDQIQAKEALHQVESRFSERLSTIETDTAKAITSIGNNMESLSESLTKRQAQNNAALTKAISDLKSETQAQFDKTTHSVQDLIKKVELKQSNPDEIVAQKISELTAQTQAEFDKSTYSIQSRLEKLEQAEREAALIRPDALTNDMTANVSALSAQVEALQSQLASIDASFTALQTQTNIMGQELAQLQDGGSVSSIPSEVTNIVPFASTPKPVFGNNPYTMGGTTGQDISGSTALAPAPALNAMEMPADYHTENSALAEHKAVEFVPTAYPTTPQQSFDTPTEHLQPTLSPSPDLAPAFVPPLSAPHPTYTPSAQTYEEASFEAPPITAPVDMSLTSDGVNNIEPSPQLPPPALMGSMDVDAMPVGELQLPYSDPAYAETEEHMDAMRIAGDTEKKKRGLSFKFKKKDKAPKSVSMPDEKTSEQKPPRFTNRNLRVAALATGLTLVTILAARAFMPSDTNQALETVTPQAENIPPSENTLSNLTPSEASLDATPSAQAEPTKAIGVYVDNSTPNIAPSQAATLEAAAEEGDPIAEYQLGLSLLEQDKVTEGTALIRKAATTLPAAQYRLAKLYDAGLGVKKDAATARELTERAARGGNRIAMHDLAIYYAYGNGDVSVDMSTAAGWFEKAAERGVVDSQFNLAILYETGQGVATSPMDAYFWYSIAAAQGDQSAEARTAALAETMQPADLASAQERVSSFRPVKINPAANGIFNDLPWMKNNGRRNVNLQVKQAQTLLSDLGFEVGTPDGIMGKKTREAIVSFERVNGLEETGRVTTALLNRLSAANGA